MPMVLTTAETAMFRLGTQMPDGTIVGARGPNGVLADDNELNRWFQSNFTERYGTPPVYSAYHMAHAILGLKAAYDKAAGAKGGAQPTTDEVIAAFENLTFEIDGPDPRDERSATAIRRSARPPTAPTSSTRRPASRRSSTWSATRRHASTRPTARPAPSGSRPACRAPNAAERRARGGAAARRPATPERSASGARPMLTAFAILVDGLVYASWLFIVAIGLSLIFGVMKILNVAHGAFYAFGAYGAATLVGLYFEAELPVAGGFAAMLLAAVLIGLILGSILERGLLRWVYGRDEVIVVLVTYAVFLILEDVLRLIWGARLLLRLPALRRARQRDRRRDDHLELRPRPDRARRADRDRRLVGPEPDAAGASS